MKCNGMGISTEQGARSIYRAALVDLQMDGILRKAEGDLFYM